MNHLLIGKHSLRVLTCTPKSYQTFLPNKYVAVFQIILVNTFFPAHYINLLPYFLLVINSLILNT